MEQLRSDLRRVVLRLAIADIVVLALSIWGAWQLRVGLGFWRNEITDSFFPPDFTGGLILLTWLVMLLVEGSYSLRVLGEGPEAARRITRASLLTAGTIAMVFYVAHYPLARGFVVLAFAFGIPALQIERYIARKLLHGARRRGRLTHRVLAIGEAQSVSEVASVLDRETYVGMHIVGACLTGDAQGDIPVPVLGPVSDLLAIVQAHDVDTVLVARGGFETATELRRVTWDLEDSGLDVVIVPSLTDVSSQRVQMRPVAGLPLLHLERPTARSAGGWQKRLFDVVGSIVLIVLLSPLMLTIAIVIKLQDRGSVLFAQERVGRGGEPFAMLKFRSMVVNAHRMLDEVANLNESDGVVFKVREDPRITRAGRLLRRYSLDELPQLLNVLDGAMSLVGPRPPLPSEVEQYGVDAYRRLAVRPGMTGLWQVSGRSDLTWDDSLRLDLFYVDNWSLTSDLIIIFKTIRAVVGASGAY